MNTLTFDVIRIVRTALRSIAFYFSIIVIAMMAMVKPAHAHGGVFPSQIWGTTLSGIGGFCLLPSLSTSVACYTQFSIQNPNSYYVQGYCHTPVSTVMTSESTATYTYVSYAYSDCTKMGTGTHTFNVFSTACPAHSTPTGSGCTCNDPTEADPTNYVPDEPLRTSCVPEAVCPDHASGTPCVCDAGYQFDPTKTLCEPVVVCTVDPLPQPPFPASDECSNSLEKGAGKDVDHKCPDLTPDMVKGASCLADKIHALAIPYSEPSGTVRTTAYQKHFRDVWDKSEEIKNKKDWLPGEKQECSAVIADVTNEMAHHGIEYEPSDDGDDAPHVLRRAIDIPKAVVKALIAKVPTTTTVSMLPGCLSCSMTIPYDVEDYVNSATVNPPACDLSWGGLFSPVDPVHFQLP